MTGKPAYFVGPWDLHRDMACVPRDPSQGTVVLVESVNKGGALPYHRKKLVLVLSAQHHFVTALQQDGYQAEMIRARSYVRGIAKHVQAHGSTRVIAMKPREWGLQQALAQAERDGTFGVPLELHDDGGDGGHFLLTRQEFADWAQGRKQLRMDQFYRWMRKRTGWLMQDGQPVGGQWSYDADNRKKVPKGTTPPPLVAHSPDAMTRDIMARVQAWPGHWGDTAHFDWPVTREGALRELEDFFTHRAEKFGDYEDAMVHGQPFLWHARLSVAMNLSLLHPREIVERALHEWRQGRMPINAAEGFVRQIIGWREFMRGAYWHQMPGLRQANLLRAQRPLPDFYWNPEKTQMRCMQDCVGAVKEHGYAHHIPRLMVLGNFALLAGLSPIEVSHWFWAGFVDAYEWVELPNVHNMALFADDSLTTKPYAASGSYIHKMSDHCKGCHYKHKERVGEQACPFNHLFWTFMERHRERLRKNYRLAALYKTWDRWDESHREEIRQASKDFLDAMPASDHGWSFDDDAC